mgnify:CR=1 FL=1
MLNGVMGNHGLIGGVVTFNCESIPIFERFMAYVCAVPWKRIMNICVYSKLIIVIWDFMGGVGISTSDTISCIYYPIC